MKKQKSKNSSIDLTLNPEELLLEQALESGEFQQDPNFAKNKTMLEEAAARHLALHRAKPITIRVNQLDLIMLKAKAKNKQIPYQTLLGSLIHQYAQGSYELSL